MTRLTDAQLAELRTLSKEPTLYGNKTISNAELVALLDMAQALNATEDQLRCLEEREAALEEAAKPYGYKGPHDSRRPEGYLLKALNASEARVREIQEAILTAHMKGLPANWEYVDWRTTLDLLVAECCTTRQERDSLQAQLADRPLTTAAIQEIIDFGTAKVEELRVANEKIAAMTLIIELRALLDPAKEPAKEQGA